MYKSRSTRKSPTKSLRLVARFSSYNLSFFITRNGIPFEFLFKLSLGSSVGLISIKCDRLLYWLSKGLTFHQPIIFQPNPLKSSYQKRR